MTSEFEQRQVAKYQESTLMPEIIRLLEVGEIKTTGIADNNQRKVLADMIRVTYGTEAESSSRIPT